MLYLIRTGFILVLAIGISNCLSIGATDNIFETPDLSIDYESDYGTAHIDAYRTTNNDKIIASKDPSKYGGLKWVSIGSPRLTQVSSYSHKNSTSLFHFYKGYFSVYFEMLSKKDKLILQKEVKRVKGLDVSIDSFINIKPNDINCLVNIFNMATEKYVILKGKVYDFKTSPYQIKFHYSRGHPDRVALENMVKLLDEEELHIECKLTSGSQIKKTNTFTLTLQEINNLNLVDKLFGDSSEKYLTRDQLTELSNEINNNFQVVEDYQMSQNQFSTTFVESLISLSGESAFKPVSIEKALESLSKYSFDFSGDLVADQITKDISNIFKVEKTVYKSHIVFDERFYNELEQQSASGGSASASARFLGIGGGKASGSFAKSQKEHWLDKGSSLNDQLSDLNNYSKNSIQYEFDGNKIIPKSLKCSKIQSSLFKKSLTFSRIKNFYFEADLIEDFTLTTRKTLATPTVVSDFANQLSALKSTIKIVGQNELRYFDMEGKGFDKFAGWYICDGKNGTPDLRGRFLVGKHDQQNEFNKLGQTGGLSRVKLTINQMPKHTHSDKGHSHSINLNTNNAGSHFHEYKDIYFSEWVNHLISKDYENVPNSQGHAGPVDDGNVGWQFSRNTVQSGAHEHNVNGQTSASNINLNESGGDLDHENLPPYYVVAYIIYLQ